MIPLLLSPMMKACPLEESYLLPDDIFCQPMSYVMVSLTLLLFFSLYVLAYHSPYDLLLSSSVSFIYSWRASSIAKFLTNRPAMPAFASIFVNFFSWIPAKVDSAPPIALLILYPHLRLFASQRPIGSWYSTIWVLHIGSHQNDVWCAEEDEEKNDGYWGICLVFLGTLTLNGGI